MAACSPPICSRSASTSTARRSSTSAGRKGTAIIGDRAFAALPERVAQLGRATCAGLLAGGVLPVIKHIPGHGRAAVDSHEALPVVDAPAEELQALDFVPFAALADMPLAMTAHVVYAAFDPDGAGDHVCAWSFAR